MKPNQLIILLLTLATLLFCSEPLYDWLTGLPAVKGLYRVEPSVWNDILILTMTMLGCLTIDNFFHKARRINISVVIWVSVLLLSITTWYRICHSDGYTPFKMLDSLKYADCLIAWELVLLIVGLCLDGRRKVYYTDRSNGQEARPLYDDEDAVDLLNRKKDAARLARQIKFAYNDKGAVGIAVTGDWGAGKSWFIYQVYKQLVAEGEICVDYHPWVYGDKDLTHHFYSKLDDILETNHIANHDITQLVRDMEAEALDVWGKGLLAVRQIFGAREDKNELIHKIKDAFVESGHHVIIFIDDCDRLQEDELLQILSLIRNTGDIPGLIYVLGYNEKQLEHILRGQGGSDYVKKMINYTYKLPPINDTTLSEVFSEEMSKLLGKDVKKEVREELISIHITEYLDTLREVKRYWNQVLMDFKLWENTYNNYLTCTKDFCLLELLRYTDNDVYEGIRYHKDDWMVLKKDGGNAPRYALKANMPKHNALSQRLLERLFRKGDVYDTEDIFGVANELYYPVYFETSSMIARLTPYSSIAEALNGESFIAAVGKWIHEGKKDVLNCIAGSYKCLTRKNLFIALLHYIYETCEVMGESHGMKDATSGHTKQHTYQRMAAIVNQTDVIQDLAFQVFLPHDGPGEVDGKDTMDDLIGQTVYPKELMAIMMCQLRKSTSKDVEYEYARDYIYDLWNRIQKESDLASPDDILDLLDILGDSTLEETYEKMVEPLLKDDLQLWLSTTIRLLKSEHHEFYILKTRPLAALFSTKAQLVDAIRKIMTTASPDDKQYLGDYDSLISNFTTLMNGIHKMNDNENSTDKDDKFVRPVTDDLFIPLETSHYPHLKPSPIGWEPFMPIGAALMQAKETKFWKDETNRIHREEDHVYFGDEI